MDIDTVVKALGALAQETRLGIYRLLVRAGSAGMPAGLIAAKLDVPGPTLSFHLKELAHAGLVTSESQGRFLYYRADYRTMNSLLDFLTENCCRGSQCAGDTIVRVPIPTPASRRVSNAPRADQIRESPMKRFHVHVAVPNLDDSVRFYSALFGAEPVVRKDDYAKWMLDDPRINFAVSQRGAAIGINHLGFQVDSDRELEALHVNLEAADRAVVAQRGANCCYAKSDKYWVNDPSGIAWESFHTLGSIPMFGADEGEADMQSACCAPATAAPPSGRRAACCS